MEYWGRGALLSKKEPKIPADIYSDITKMEKKDHQSKLVRYTLFMAYDKECFYCHEPLSNFAEIQIDHFIPQNPETPLKSIIEECGLPAFFEINSFYNLTPMHAGCNNRKGARLSDKKTIRLVLFDIKKKVPKIESVERDLIKGLKNTEARQQLETAIEKGLISPGDLLKYVKPESLPKETAGKILPKNSLGVLLADFSSTKNQAIDRMIPYGTSSQIIENISDLFTEFQVLMSKQSFKQIFARWSEFKLLFKSDAFYPDELIIDVGGSSIILINYKFGNVRLQLEYNGQSFAAIVILGDKQVPHTDPTFPRKLEEFFNEIKDCV